MRKARVGMWLLFLLVFAGVSVAALTVGGIAWFALYNRGGARQAAVLEKPEIVTNATVMIGENNNNSAAFKKRFGGRVVQVSSNRHSVEERIVNRKAKDVLVLAGDGIPSRMLCEFSDPDDLALIGTKKPITIIGVVAGVEFGDIRMTECRVVSRGR